MGNQDLTMMFESMGYEVLIVEGNKSLKMHEKMAKALDYAIEKILKMKNDKTISYKLPLIILKTPKGWTGPKIIDGNPIENSFRSHQVPFLIDNDIKLNELEKWLKSYKPEELFDKNGKLYNKYKLFIPKFEKRMGNSNYTKGGISKLKYPSIYKYNVKEEASAMLELSKYLRDAIKLNPNNFRIFGPDEALSNRLNHVFEATNRTWELEVLKTDQYLKESGRIFDSFLSENICEGLLEGYVLTGRHGIFHTYEAFSRIVDSMISQHLKWLKSASNIRWRKALPSLNIILTSHVYEQDHNGYTHQEVGILNHLISKDKELIGIYLPPCANTLIYTMDKCLKDKNKVNLIVASKHIKPTYFNMNEAKCLVDKGLGIINSISDDNPDIVLTCCGDTPTLEVMESVKILKKYLNIKVRVVCIIDLLKFKNLNNEEFKKIFLNVPNVFVFHGYPNLIYEMLYNRNVNMKVVGYVENGAITTPFDMRVKNKIDRFNICLTLASMLKLDTKKLEDYCNNMLKNHKNYIKKNYKDMDVIKY